MLQKGVCAAAVLLLAISTCAAPVRRDAAGDTFDISSLFGPQSGPGTPSTGDQPAGVITDNISTGAPISALDPSLGGSTGTTDLGIMNTSQQPLGGLNSPSAPSTPDINTTNMPPGDFSSFLPPGGTGGNTTPSPAGPSFNTGEGPGLSVGGLGAPSAGLPPQAKPPPKANVGQGVAKKIIGSLEGPKVQARTMGPPFDVNEYLKKHPKAELTGGPSGPGGVLAVGNCNYELKVQPDGNIVIDGKEKLIVWSTKTSGLWNGFNTKDITLKLDNGQLRSYILNARAQPKSKEWKTDIAPGHALPKKAILGPSGNLLVLDEQGNILWSTAIDKSYECKNAETLMNALGTETQRSVGRISA